MKVLYVISHETVRNVCVANNFYTAGTIDEYENMFWMITKNNGTMPAEDVAEIAKDIAAHSNEGVTVEFVTERLLNAAYIIVR